ncbi:hypothetical protein Q3Y64_00315 [Uliginosibacterium sp. 31-12]|nr:hypothetical protein [Uliginosibacterium sp. 31-12]
MKVGFIGLGLAGRPVDFDLVRAKHEQVVWSCLVESMVPVLEELSEEAGDA